MSDADEVERLRRRLDREHRARIEAEAIAEQGIRDLYRANQTLDARIAERTRELEEARRAAEEAEAAKGEFLAHISHEVRTPINGLSGMLELLQDEVTGRRGQEWLASARESSDRLAHLFDRVLWFIELESAEVMARAEPRAVEALLDAAAERGRGRCARAGQLLSVEPETPADCTVHATEDLVLAIDELLDNAARHGEPGPVRLSARLLGNRVRVAVDDTGPGMGEEVAATATEMLDPGESATTRRTTGAGIGLALVRRISAALEGTSGVEPNEEGGTRAWILLPAGPDQLGSTASR